MDQPCEAARSVSSLKEGRRGGRWRGRGGSGRADCGSRPSRPGQRRGRRRWGPTVGVGRDLTTSTPGSLGCCGSGGAGHGLRRSWVGPGCGGGMRAGWGEAGVTGWHGWSLGGWPPSAWARCSLSERGYSPLVLSDGFWRVSKWRGLRPPTGMSWPEAAPAACPFPSCWCRPTTLSSLAELLGQLSAVWASLLGQGEGGVQDTRRSLIHSFCTLYCLVWERQGYLVEGVRWSAAFLGRAYTLLLSELTLGKALNLSMLSFFPYL